jgi:hypothetical protein
MTREELLAKHGQPFRVLDYGHVRLVDVMGDDAIERGDHRREEGA